MKARELVIAAGIALLLALLLSLFVGSLVAPFLAGTLVAGAMIGFRTAGHVTESSFSRALARGSAAVVITLGLVMRTVLVGNPGDNAYLWIAVLGMLLMLPALPFALAAIVPHRASAAWLMRAGIVILWVFGVPGLAFLAVGGPLYLASTPPDGVLDPRVPIFHLLSLLLLAGTLVLVGVYWPRLPAPDRAGPEPRA